MITYMLYILILPLKSHPRS